MRKGGARVAAMAVVATAAEGGEAVKREAATTGAATAMAAVAAAMAAPVTGVATRVTETAVVVVANARVGTTTLTAALLHFRLQRR